MKPKCRDFPALASGVDSSVDHGQRLDSQRETQRNLIELDDGTIYRKARSI